MIGRICVFAGWFMFPGNMWGQSWKNIFDIVMPYPGKRRVDVSAEMVRQGYTPIR